MKITQQTPLELTLQLNPDKKTRGFILVWASGFSGIPLLIILTFIFNLGVITLTCKRVEPTPISCQMQQAKLLGLIQEPPTVFNQVIRAKFNSKEDTDSDGDRTVENWVTLATNTEEVNVIEDSITINGVRGSESEMLAITNQINRFIYSQQPTLTIQRDTRRDLGKHLFLLEFWSIYVIIVAGVFFVFFQFRTLIFDKNSNRFIYIKRTLLGKKSQEYPLYEITGTNIETKKDSEGDPRYELRLLPKSIYVISSNDLTEVQNLQKAIQDFLHIV